MQIRVERTSLSVKEFMFILNQLFEIERKVDKIQESNSIHRNIKRLKEYFENGILDNQLGISYHNPIGEKFDETRTDCEASIAGKSTENLVITEVIKPIIRIHQGGRTKIIQRAVVVVKSKNN